MEDYGEEEGRKEGRRDREGESERETCRTGGKEVEFKRRGEVLGLTAWLVMQAEGGMKTKARSNIKRVRRREGRRERKRGLGRTTDRYWKNKMRKKRRDRERGNTLEDV